MTATADKTENTTAMGRKRSTIQKIVETGFCITTWLALGLYLEIFGPTLIDLKIKLQTDYEQVAVAVSGRSVGLFPGCVIGGMLVDKFGRYSHLMIAVCLDIAAMVTVAVPFSPNVGFLWAFCFIGGLVEAVINVAGQRIILNIWLEKSATPMILLHMGYGIGSFIIPLYTDPFLAVERPDATNGTTVIHNATYLLLGRSTAATELSTMSTNGTGELQISKYIKDSTIEYSYAISASAVALLSVAFYTYQIRERQYHPKSTIEQLTKETSPVSEPANDINKESRTVREMINPATCAGGHFWYGVQIFFLVFLYFGNASGGERMIAGFIRTFSIDQLDFESYDASLLNTSFWISFTLGRLIFALLARWISVRILIIIESGGLTVITILMAIFASHSSLACWILVQPLGFFLAPLWPTGIAWIDYHLELTGLGMTLTMLGGSLGGIAHLRLIGYLFEHIGPQTFLYQAVGYGSLALIIATLMDIVGAQHGSRFNKGTDVNAGIPMTEKSN